MHQVPPFEIGFECKSCTCKFSVLCSEWIDIVEMFRICNSLWVSFCVHEFNLCTGVFQRYKFYGINGRPDQMSVKEHLSLAIPSHLFFFLTPLPVWPNMIVDQQCQSASELSHQSSLFLNADVTSVSLISAQVTNCQTSYLELKN